MFYVETNPARSAFWVADFAPGAAKMSAGSSRLGASRPIFKSSAENVRLPALYLRQVAAIQIWGSASGQFLQPLPEFDPIDDRIPMIEHRVAVQREPLRDKS
jgi:hypothetical protein